ncbi:MAG: hypothetical protein R2744_05320 [Bacteroidales bacterium]
MPLAALISSSAAPVLMGTQNWDDHDRSAGIQPQPWQKITFES